MGDNIDPQGGSDRESVAAAGSETAADTDGGSGEQDAIETTVEELFESRGRDRLSTEIEDAVTDESLSVEAHIKLQEALREVDLVDADTVAAIRADLESVLTDQESIETDIRTLLIRVRELERTLETERADAE
jgi:hypothetical protein